MGHDLPNIFRGKGSFFSAAYGGQINPPALVILHLQKVTAGMESAKFTCTTVQFQYKSFVPTAILRPHARVEWLLGKEEQKAVLGYKPLQFVRMISTLST